MLSTPRHGRITPRGRSSSVCSRPCGLLASPPAAHASLAVPRARRRDGEVPRALRDLRRPGRAHRPVLDGAHPAGKDRAQAAPSAVRGDPHVVPAVAGVRRAALAAGLAVGVHKAGGLQAGLRNRQASRLLQGARPPGAGQTPPPTSGSAWPRSKGAACRPSELDAIRTDLAALESRLAASDAGARWAEWKSCCSASTASSSG